MEELKIKSLNEKKATVFLFNISKKLIKKDNMQCLVDFLKAIKINFIVIENEDDKNNSSLNSTLKQITEKLKAPYYIIDIPDYVKGYIYEDILGKEAQLEELFEEFLSSKDPDSVKSQNLLSWIYVLENEIKDLKSEYLCKIKPLWITKQIVDMIKKMNSSSIKFAHFSQKSSFKEILRSFKDLNMEIIVNKKLQKSVIFNIITNQEDLEKWKY